MPSKKKPSWDAEPRKARSDAKLKNLPEEVQETMWLLLHPTDLETPAYSQEQVLVYLLEELEVSSSTGALSEWHSSYSLRKRTERTLSRVAQAQQLLLEKDPTASEEHLQKLGQMVFTAESIEDGNLKGFVALIRESTRQKVVRLDERKIAMLEAAAAQAKAKLEAITNTAKSKGGISPETLAEIEEAAGLL
jgi:hypothetical protein